MPGIRMALGCAKVEATPGVAETLAGTDAVRLSLPCPPPGEMGEVIDRQLLAVRSDYGGDHSAVARYYQGPNLSLMLAHPASLGAAVEAAPFLRAAGYVETLVAVTSSAYVLSGDANFGAGLQAFTLGLYEGPTGEGKRYIARGCRCQIVWTIPFDGPARLEIQPLGGYTTPADAALLSPTFNAGIPVAGAAGRLITLTDGTLTLNDELAIRGALKITTPYKPEVRPSAFADSASNAFGYRLPCYMTPGRSMIELEIESTEESIIPLEALLVKRVNQTLLTATMTLDDSDGATTFRCTHTARGLRLATKAPSEGPPRLDALTFRCGDLTSASHEVSFAVAT